MNATAAALAVAVVAVVLAVLAVVAQRIWSRRVVESEQRYRSVVELAGQILFETDERGRLTHRGPGFDEIAGVGDDGADHDTLDAVHPDDRAAVAAAFRDLMSGARSVITGDIRIIDLRTGRIREVRAFSAPRRRGNRIVGLVGTLIDVTETNRLEAAARATDHREQSVLDGLGEGVLLLDPAATILRVNPKAVELAGPDLVGRSALRPGASLVDHDGRPLALSDAPVARALATGAAVEDAVVGVRRGEATAWRRISVRHLPPDVHGAATGMVVVFRDISEEIAGLAELDQARSEAERANEAKTEFMRRLHHELRTPLNAVSTAAQLLDERDLPEDERRIAARILKGCRLALGLMEELREISLIEDGQLRLRHDATDVAEVLSQATAIVEHLEGPGGVSVEIEPFPPEVRVWADAKRLSQVLVNLMSNAVKYNRPGGKVTLRVVVGNDHVGIEVEDTGRGVAPEDLGRMFEPFERLDAPRSGVEGTGLGLSISKRLIETMDGQLLVVSRLGEGSTFTAQLARAPSAPPAPPPSPVIDDEHVSPGGGHDDPVTVLYVEDNPDNIELMEEVFARWPHLHLVTAMTGAAGLRQATELLPTLILLDLHLPDSHGMEVLDGLRADPATASIPVIMVTADATGWEHEVPAGQRPEAIVTKPLDVRSFCALVERWVQRRTAA